MFLKENDFFKLKEFIVIKKFYVVVVIVEFKEALRIVEEV